MIESQKTELKKLWVMIAAYYQVKLADAVLQMYVEDVEDLRFEDIKQALNTYRRNPRNRTCPLPAHVRDVVAPQQSDDSLAVDVATRIEDAIHKFGYMQPEQAKEYIGDIGWHVVARRGGWCAVCEDTTPLGVRIKHFEQSAKSLIDCFKAGQLGETPTFTRLDEKKKHEYDQRLLAGKLKQFGEAHPEAIGELVKQLAIKKGVGL